MFSMGMEEAIENNAIKWDFKNTYLEKSAGIGGLTKDAIGLRWT